MSNCAPGGGVYEQPFNNEEWNYFVWAPSADYQYHGISDVPEPSVGFLAGGILLVAIGLKRRLVR